MWVVVGGGGVESEFSDRFGYSLALAKPNNSKRMQIKHIILVAPPFKYIGREEGLGPSLTENNYV